MPAMQRRALMPGDAGVVRAFLESALAGSRYVERAREMLDSALAFDDPEYMCLLALSGSGDVGCVALFGAVGGADRVVKVHAIVGGDTTTQLSLLDAITSACIDAGERMIVCELPDDAPLRARTLEQSGYLLEGRVSDFTADGIDLRLFVWRNAGP